MWMDAVDLRDFYATSLGRAARRLVRHRLRQVWPDVKGGSILGVGYATPFLSPFLTEADRVLAAMPARQGVLHWPAESPGLTTLCEENELPFPDLSMDFAVLVHTLEFAENVQPLMREIWRVLSDAGRLVVIAPNRNGLWSRFERTPFGHGRPYSQGQLSRLLRDTLFTPIESHAALFVPPIQSRMLLSSAPAWEELGSRWFTSFSGVVMTEAAKQLYAGQPQAQEYPRRAYLPIPQRKRKVFPGRATSTRGAE